MEEKRRKKEEQTTLGHLVVIQEAVSSKETKFSNTVSKIEVNDIGDLEICSQ